MRVGTASLVVAWTLVAGCKPPRDPRAVERLVPLAVSPPTPGARTSTDAGRTPGTSGTTATGVAITDRPAPDGALGVHWGMSRAEVTQGNRTAGIACTDSAEYLFCPRALVPVPTAVIVTYEFCTEHLCSVALDGVRTRDEARIDRDYTALLSVMDGALGVPSVSARRVGPGCAGHLALCLTSHQAEFRARWSWPDGAQGMVSADEDESDAFLAQVSATYLSPERVHRGDPDLSPDPLPPPDAGEPSR